MAHLFLLKQKDLELAVAEAKAAGHGWGWWERPERPQHGVLVLDTRKTPRNGLGLTRRIVKLLAQCARGNIRSTLESIAWSRHIGGRTFKVAVTKQTAGDESERELATVIWRATKKPRIDLERPQVCIDIVLVESVAYIGVRAWENEEDFESRRAHLRPHMHPSSMHPALARALVNLTCASSLHDPFCGSGGILIEAGLAHKRASGADIDAEMIVRARKNCANYHLRPELRIADATQWLPRTQALVADLPYGKNTTPVALKPLLEAFLMRAQRSTARAVVGLPHEMAFPSPWRARAHITSYVHKSMTKHFYILEKAA